MRPALVAGLAALSLSCASTPAAPPPGPLDDLSWMAGRWVAERDTPEGPEIVEESWTSPRGDAFFGTSHTQVAGKTTFFEYLRVQSSTTGVDYVASPLGKRVVRFKRIESGPSHATFANPAHDFPTHIRYQRRGDTLIAEIWGDSGDKRAWRFTRAP